MDEKRAAEAVQNYETAAAEAGGRDALLERFGVVTVKLREPLQVRGEAVQELHLDFLGLTGLDMEAIDDEIGVMNLRGLIPAYSRRYQRKLAARASGVPEAALLTLPLADYNAVVGAAQSFLLISG